MSAQLSVAAVGTFLAVAALSGCGSAVLLRQEQARELRSLCASLVARTGGSNAAVARAGELPLDRFRVGQRGGPVNGIDVILHACP